METISTIKVVDLKPWYKPSDYDNEYQESEEVEGVSVKFGISPVLNKKIFLCQGGISQLELDCIVLPINEMTLTKSSLAMQVHQAAGSSLSEFYKNHQGIKTGNVVLGSGFHLPSRFIVHAMEPGMNAKFKNAVENSIHRCYLNAMQVALENKFKTIGFTSLYESVTDLLSEEMAHMALGTVRCFMEKHEDQFQAIVFCVNKNDLNLYLKLLPAYFPRSQNEATEAAYLLALRNLGEWGDKVVADRAIRISHISLNKSIPATADTTTTPLKSGQDEGNSSDSSLGSIPDKNSFFSVDGDHDERRKRQIDSMDETKQLVARDRIYKRLLRLAHNEELSVVSETHSLYLSGLDRQSDPVVVIVANRINIPEMDADKALLFFIRTLDPIVNSKFSIVYFHTMSQSYNHPSLGFIKRVYNVLDSRYTTNLKRLYMVHPTIASRVFTWFFTTFSATAVKRQILTIKNIPQLYKYIAPDQINIPPFVSDYDLKVNQEVYQKEAELLGETYLSQSHCEL